jgi:hypothetical protein
VNDLSCARCLSGQCDHVECRTRGFGMAAETTVQGTACCPQCAPVLMELVVHPLMALTPVSPEPRAARDGMLGHVSRYLPLETHSGEAVFGDPAWDALTAARDRGEVTVVTQDGVIVAAILPAEPRS